jgi:cytochrome c-type biogenesis protein CcmE
MTAAKYRTIILFAAALALLVIAIVSLSDDILSPYVPFREAQSSPGRYVQVIGSLEKTAPVDHAEGSFTFTLADKDGVKMRAIHRGTKPQNFEHTEQVVLLGRYSPESRLFEADKVLVKCPSKYRRQQ